LQKKGGRSSKKQRFDLRDGIRPRVTLSLEYNIEGQTGGGEMAENGKRHGVGKNVRGIVK